MKKILITSILFIAFLCQESMAQSWSKAIGVRLGFPNSITYKQFVSEKLAVEAVLGTRGFSGYRTINVSAALQLHNPLLEDELGGLRWYYGAGAGVVTYNFKDSFGFAGDSGASFLIQGYLGVDYTFEDAPVNISLDWVPSFFLNGFGSGFGADGGSVAIRYIF